MQDEHKLHCFTCQKIYDIQDLVRKYENIQDPKEIYKFLLNKYGYNDTIPQGTKVIPFKAPTQDEQKKEQGIQQTYNFTKAIENIYDKQTDKSKQHFKDRRTYRRDNRRI